MDKMFFLAESEPKFVYEYAEKRVWKLEVIGLVSFVINMMVDLAAIGFMVAFAESNEWKNFTLSCIPLPLSMIWGMAFKSKENNAYLLRDFAYRKYKPIIDEENCKRNRKAKTFIENNPDILELANTEAIQERVMVIVKKHMGKCGEIDKDAVIGELSKSN